MDSRAASRRSDLTAVAGLDNPYRLSPRPARRGTARAAVIGTVAAGGLLAVAGSAAAADIYGDDGDNILIDTPGDDRIFGLGGNDIIISSGGNDWVDAGAGEDNISLGDGANVVYGGEGEDNISLGNGANVVYGGEGEDNIVTGDGANVVYGGEGEDNIVTGNGDDYIDGGADAADNIAAGLGVNTIVPDAQDLVTQVDRPDPVPSEPGDDGLRDPEDWFGGIDWLKTDRVDMIDLQDPRIPGVQSVPDLFQDVMPS